jgi:hypothetical protein
MDGTQPVGFLKPRKIAIAVALACGRRLDAYQVTWYQWRRLGIKPDAPGSLNGVDIVR